MFPNGVPAKPEHHPDQSFASELAQLLANIVDYIDSDDISTAFVWNPINPNDPLNPANFNSMAALGNSVVFGVEKPRLVLNEAYAEATNDPNDATFHQPPGKPPVDAKNAPYVRFWLELVNPSNNPLYSGAGPMGTTGHVRVRYTQTLFPTLPQSYSAYQIQIVRSNQPGQAGLNVSNLLSNPVDVGNAANVTGAIATNNAGTLTPFTPDITWDFSAGDKTPGFDNVFPMNGVPGTLHSMLICAAQNTPFYHKGEPDFRPTVKELNGTIIPGLPTNSPQHVIVATSGPGTQNTSLTYNTVQLQNALNKNDRIAGGLQHHVVLLRRLANPYMLPNDPISGVFNPALPPNPYITVDYMDYVPATDRILRRANTHTDRTPGPPNGYAANPASLGKVQPYASFTPTNGQIQAGNSGPSTGTYNFTFPTSLVLPETFSPPGKNATKYAVNQTFGYINSANPANAVNLQQTYEPSTSPTNANGIAKLTNNGTDKGTQETLMLPNNWFTHLDRTLINQIELLQVSTGKPHEYTLRTIVPNNAGTDVTPYSYMAVNAMNSSTNTLYRALDVLRIQPYGNNGNTPLGGRAAGRININTIQDKRIWDAWLDAQPSYNGFTQNDVNTMWKQMIGSRTVNQQPRYFTSYTTTAKNTLQLVDTTNTPYSTPIPGPSVYDKTTVAGSVQAVNGTDRPFLPFGAPTFGGGSNFAYSAGSGLFADTLLRNGNAGPGTPAFITTASGYTSQASIGGAHPYQQVEALRKIMNNTTTVSNTFAVWVTVGYFDYNITVGNNVNISKLPTTGTLGAEYYNQVPGDLRRKYFAVVDRSQAGFDLTKYVTSLNDIKTSQAGTASWTALSTTYTGVGTASTTTLPLAPPNPNQTLPSSTIVVASTTGFPNSGNLVVQTSTGLQTVAYTGVAANPSRFTGCSGGTGTIAAGTTVGSPSNSNMIAAGGTALQSWSNSAWTPGGTYVFGVGATQEIVTFSKNPPTPAAGPPPYTYTIVSPAKGFQFNHYSGEPFSASFIPGNPGPQANFNYAIAPYSGTVVQYTARLQ